MRHGMTGRLLAASSAVGLLASCGSSFQGYEGSRRSSEEVAIIEGAVVGLDGRAFERPMERVEVLPGRHSFVFLVNHVYDTSLRVGIRVRGDCVLSATFEPGVRYRFRVWVLENDEARQREVPRIDWEAGLLTQRGPILRCDCQREAGQSWPAGGCGEAYGPDVSSAGSATKARALFELDSWKERRGSVSSGVYLAVEPLTTTSCRFVGVVACRRFTRANS